MERSEIQEKQCVKASNPVLRCTSHRLPTIPPLTKEGVPLVSLQTTVAPFIQVLILFHRTKTITIA